MRLQALLIRLAVDDGGQDLVEYGLLAAIIGIVGVLVFPVIATKMDAAYLAWTGGAYADWCPDDPISAGGAACVAPP